MNTQDKPTYNILWLEDEPHKQDGFETSASDHSLRITHVETVKDLRKTFQSNPPFDGAILDAKGKLTADTNETLGALTHAITGCRGRDRDLPIVVFTGQKNKNSEAWEVIEDGLPEDVNCYNKNSPEEEEKMFKHLRGVIENRPRNSIRKKYRDIYEFCSGKDGIGREAWNSLSELLLKIESNNSDKPFDPNDLKSFRDIFGLLARAFKKKGLFPTELCNPRVNHRSFMHFLKGDCEGYSQIGYPALPRLFSDSLIYFYLKVLQTAKHLEANEEEALDPEVEAEIGKYNHATGGKNHLLQTITYLTIDLLRMAKGIFENSKYTDPEHNKKLWKEALLRGVKGRLQKVSGFWEVHLNDEREVARLELNRLETRLECSENLPVEVDLKLNSRKSPKYLVTKITPVTSA